MEKHYVVKFIAAAILLISGVSLVVQKSNNHNPPPTPTVYYDQADQVGRPAINTVFIPASGKDSFNMTTPTQMPSIFTNDMKTSLHGSESGLYNQSAGFDS